ncbi:MAG: hypothetical protein HC841_03485 [Verrucomicrobiae bacterium]|nr:hypothetical protein [Verrucomicrobiae bacterium]
MDEQNLTALRDDLLILIGVQPPITTTTHATLRFNRAVSECVPAHTETEAARNRAVCLAFANLVTDQPLTDEQYGYLLQMPSILRAKQWNPMTALWESM